MGECCYYNGGYLAEPQKTKEQAKMENYIVASTGPDKQNTWWLGGTDMHAEEAGGGCLVTLGSSRTGMKENQTTRAARTALPSTVKLATGGWTWAVTPWTPSAPCSTTPSARRG